jgi:hypothetical protein
MGTLFRPSRQSFKVVEFAAYSHTWDSLWLSARVVPSLRAA